MKKFMIFFMLGCWLTASAGRPKVGLVLGGGGAKGAAEVGVLKVIEKADELGLATELIEMLRGSALLYEKWSAAVNLREDNASFASGLALVKQATGLTDDQLAGILDACVAD